MPLYRVPVVVDKDEDGYVARCPDLQGCWAQGETYEEVLANVQDAIRLHIEDRIERGEAVPTASHHSFTMVDVTV